MSPATASVIIMTGASGFAVLALVARAKATRCTSRLGRLRCALDRHPISAPHVYGDISWWDWEATGEATTPRSVP